MVNFIASVISVIWLPKSKFPKSCSERTIILNTTEQGQEQNTILASGMLFLTLSISLEMS